MRKFTDRSSQQGLDFQEGLKIYRIMRIKMKISYSAWKKGMTVTSLIRNAIRDSYYELVSNQTSKMNIDVMLSGDVTYFESLQEFINPNPQRQIQL